MRLRTSRLIRDLILFCIFLTVFVILVGNNNGGYGTKNINNLESVLKVPVEKQTDHATVTERNKIAYTNMETKGNDSVGPNKIPVTISTNIRNNVKNKSVDSRIMSDSMAGKQTLAEIRARAKQDKGFMDKILNQKYYHPQTYKILKRYFLGESYPFANYTDIKLKQNLQSNFDVYSDVIVFLHIQKTGGLHLNIRFEKLPKPFACAGKKCLSPKRRAWIYTSVYSGWPCGLHADWTQLHRCIPGQIDKIEQTERDRRYFYMTQLRDPLDRYISEWTHQTKVNHWQDAILGCGDGYSDWSDVRPCFHSANWRGVSLDDFMACPHNLATNRMARMLADLTLSNCYRKYNDENLKHSRAFSWVESAKVSLQKMEHFRFMDRTHDSDLLFENVYKLKLPSSSNEMRKTGSIEFRISEEQFLKMVKLTELDFHIYLFATDLFNERLKDIQ